MTRIEPGSRPPGAKQREATRITADRLRKMILSGRLRPGEPISQLALSRHLGVSPTPIREAIRMLTADRLLVSEHNHRARVAPLNAEDLDAVYGARVLVEAVGIAITVENATAAEMDDLQVALDRLREQAEFDDLDAWAAAHADFHRLLVAGANSFQRQIIATMFDRSERYRRLSVVDSSPRSWADADAEHERIVECCRRGDGVAAARELARHLGRTALALTATFAPEVDAVAVCASVSIVEDWGG